MELRWFFFPFFGLLWVAALVVWIWALVDCVQVKDDSLYQSGNKLVWVLIIVLLSFIGAILYFLIGRPKPGAEPRGPQAPPPGAPPPPPGSMPPPPAS